MSLMTTWRYDNIDNIKYIHSTLLVVADWPVCYDAATVSLPRVLSCDR